MEILLKKVIRKLIFIMVYCLDCIIPKKKNQMLFGSNSNRIFSGNSKSLYENFKTNKNYKVKYSEVIKNSNEGYIDLRTIEGVIYFLRSEYLVGTHGLGDFFYPFSNKKKLIQTWHGSPLKKMTLCDMNRNKKSIKLCIKHVKKISYLLSSSEVVSSSLARCFGIKEEKLLNIGYPRNDHLVNYKKSGDLAKSFGVKKIILYAPTFRDWTDVKLFPFEKFSIVALEKMLREEEAILLVRSHINEKEGDTITGERVIKFNFDKCEDINEILGEVDLLITDYSSIYFDYLLVNKPCIFLPYDLEEYKEKRGLLYDSYESLMIGDMPNDSECFIESLKSNLNEDKYEKERKKINSLFNYSQSKNTYELLLKKLEGDI